MHTKQGFTLVELSIVLVIIGLLIGGILVGQSMIHTARVTSYISKLQQVEIAVQNFKNNYKTWPGDSPGFVPPGHNLGALDAPTSTYCVTEAGVATGPYSGIEDFQVWAHLSQSGMFKGTYLPYKPISCGGPDDDDYYNTGGTNRPEFANIPDFNTITSYTGKPSIDLNVPATGSPRNYTSYFSLIDAVAIDAKMDDGHGLTGNVRMLLFVPGGGVSGSQGCEAGIPLNDTICAMGWLPDGGSMLNYQFFS